MTECNYRYSNETDSQIFVGIKLSGGRDENVALLKRLKAGGYPVTDMSDNDTAKLHIRYMVGARL